MRDKQGHREPQGGRCSWLKSNWQLWEVAEFFGIPEDRAMRLLEGRYLPWISVGLTERKYYRIAVFGVLGLMLERRCTPEEAAEIEVQLAGQQTPEPTHRRGKVFIPAWYPWGAVQMWRERLRGLDACSQEELGRSMIPTRKVPARKRRR